MDSSIIRGSFPDEEDDLGLQHNRNIGNAGQSEDIIIVVEKAIKGMLERKRFSSSNVGAANYIESECVDQEECDSNIFGENRDTGISVSALSKPVGVAHNVQFDTDHHYGFAAATAEEIRLDNEVFVNYSDSSARKDFIDNDESFNIDSDVLGSEDVSTEEVLDDLENQGQFEQLSICSLDDTRKLNYGNNCFNNITRNDSVDEFPLPAKYASVQNYKKDNKRFVKLVTNSSKNSDVNSVEITPTFVYKNNFSQNKNSRKSDSLKNFYESVASNLVDDKNDSLCVAQGTSLLTSENNGQDDKNMPVLVNENDVIISPCEDERPPPELTPQNIVSPSELTALNMISTPEFTTKVNEQVIGVVHPFNHKNNLNIDNQVSNISGLPILSSNGKPLNPPTDVITRNRLRSHCLDSVINAPRSMIKKQESFSTVILKHDGLKTMAVSTMLNGSIDKSDHIPKEVNMRQGISSGNHYRSAHKGIKHVSNEDNKDFIHVNDSRLTLTVPIRSIDKVPEKLEASDHVVSMSFNTQNEIMSKGQSIMEHDNIDVMKNNKNNACYTTVKNVKTDKLVVNENRNNSLLDNSPINMSALPSMPILLSPTMEETQAPTTKTNQGETSRKIDHTNTGRKQAPARSVATPLRSFQRLPIAELASTPNTIKNTVPKHKKKSKQDELLLSMSITNDITISVRKHRGHKDIKATRIKEYGCQTDIDPNSIITHFSSNKNELNQEITKCVAKDSLYKKPRNNTIVKNLHSPDLISSSLEPLTIETKETDSSYKTFDNLLTDLDLDKTQTNPLDESVHSLDPFIKDIQSATDILEVLPGADILDGGITDKEIIITSADVGLLKSDILEEEEQVLTLEDSTLSILNFFDKDLSSSKALECHENESFESPVKLSNKNDLPFTIPEIKFEGDKVILDRPKSIYNTNDEKPSVVEKNKLINSIEEVVSKTNSGENDDLILIPGIDSHDKIKSKVFDGYYPITQEPKKCDDSKCNLLSEIEKINEILDRELANTIGTDETISDRSPKNPSSSSSSSNVEETQDLEKTKAAKIVNETNLQVDTFQKKSEASEDRVSDKNSKVSMGSAVEIANETNLQVDTLQEKSEVSEDRVSDKNTEVLEESAVEIANETSLRVDTFQEKSEDCVSDKNSEVSIDPAVKIANKKNLQVDILQEKSKVSEYHVSDKNTEVLVGPAVKIANKTNLLVDTLQEESEDYESDTSSEVSVGSCDSQLSSKDVVLLTPEETSVVQNEIDGNYPLELENIQGTDGNTIDASMSDEKDKSYHIKSDKSHGDSNSKLSKDSSSFNIKSSAHKNNNTYTTKDPKLYLKLSSKKRKRSFRKRKKHSALKLLPKDNILSSQQKSKQNHNSETTDKSDSVQKFGATISVVNKNSTSDNLNIIPNGRISPPNMDGNDLLCQRKTNLTINIQDDICKRMLQDKISFSNIKDKDITLSILEKSEIGKPLSIKKKRNEDSLIMGGLILADENEFSPRANKEYLNLNRKHLVKSPQNIERNELKEKKAGLEAIIKKLKSEKNAIDDEYSDKWHIGEEKMDLYVLKSNENIVIEQENSDSLLSCSSKIETEIIHDNLDAQLEIELNSGKNNSIVCKIELDGYNDNAFSSIIEKTVSDLVTTTHENLSGKNIDSNVEHLTPTVTNNSADDNVSPGHNEKITLPSEKNSSILSTIATENSVDDSLPVTIPENQPLNSSLVLISKNSESTSFGNGVDSPTGSNLVIEKTLASESKNIEKAIDLIKTSDNSNGLNEIKIGKLNEYVTINNIDKVNTDSNSSKNEKNIKNLLSKPSVTNNSDIDKQNSFSLLVNKSSPLINDSCSSNAVSEYKDQIASDKLPVTTNPPGLIKELVDENEKKFMKEASKDKNDEIAPAPVTESCANGERNDNGSLILKNKLETTESIVLIGFDAATKNIIKEDRDFCVLNNLSDEVHKTVGSINDKQTSESKLQTLDKIEQNQNITVVSSANINQATDVSNSVTKTTHKELVCDYVELIVDFNSTKSINENTNTSQDTEGGIQTVAAIKDFIGVNKMTHHLINDTEVCETNVTQESVSNSENVAEKNDNTSCLENVPPVDENGVNATEKTFLEQNENPVKPINTESVNLAVSGDKNGTDVADKTNLSINNAEMTKTTENALRIASAIPISNIENSIIKVAEETFTEKLQNIKNVSNDKSCINVTDTTENTLLVSNESTKKSPSTRSVNVTIIKEENTIAVIDKTNQITPSDMTSAIDVRENVIPTVGIENFNDRANAINITKTINEVVNVPKITEKRPVSKGIIEKQQDIGSVHLNVSDDQNNITDNRQPFSEKLLSTDSVSNETSLIDVTEVTETTEKIFSVKNEGINKPLSTEGVNPAVTYKTCIDTTDNDTSDIKNDISNKENHINDTEKTLSVESLDNETDVPEVTKATDKIIDVSEATEVKESISPTVIEDEGNGEIYTEKQRSIESVDNETIVIHPAKTNNKTINITKTTEETSSINNESSGKTIAVKKVNITIGDKENYFNVTEETSTIKSADEQCVERVQNNSNSIENNSGKNIDQPQSVASVCPTNTGGEHNTNPHVKTLIENTDEGFENVNQTVCDDEDRINTTQNAEESISKENVNYIISGDENDVNVTVKTNSSKTYCIKNVDPTIKEQDEVKCMDVSLPSEVSTNSTEKSNIEKENSIEIINSKISDSEESVNTRSDLQPLLKVDLLAKTNLVASSSGLVSSKLSIPLIESTACSCDIKSSDEKVVEKPTVDSSVGDLSSASITVCKEPNSVYQSNNMKSADKCDKDLINCSSNVLRRNASKDCIETIDSDKISFYNNNTKKGDSDAVTQESEADLAQKNFVDLNTVGMPIERNTPNQEKFNKVIKENHVEPNSMMAIKNKLAPKNLLNSSASSPQLASKTSIPNRPSKKTDNRAALKRRNIINAKKFKNSKPMLLPQGSGSDKVKFPPKNNYDSSEKIGSKDNNNPETYMHEFTKYIDSNNRFQIDVMSSKENTSLLKANENPVLGGTHQSDTIIKNEDSTKSIDKESEIKDISPVNLKSETNRNSIDNTKPSDITTDSNLSNNIDLKGIEYPERSKNEEARLPVGDGNECEAVKTNSDLTIDVTNDNQVSSQPGTVYNLRLRPLSRSTELKESRPDNNEVSKTNLLLNNVINKNTNTEESPEHSNYFAAESVEQIIDNDKPTEVTETDFPHEQENIVPGNSEDSCSENQSMTSGNSGEQLKPEETPVVESGASETPSTFQENTTTEVLYMQSESKLNSFSSERFLSSCSNIGNSYHSSLSVSPSQLKLSNIVEENLAESCKSDQSMPEEINKSQVTDSTELPLTSDITFPDSTESNSRIAENSETLEKSEPMELSQGDDSNTKQGESASNVIVANYFQSNISVKPIESITVLQGKSDNDEIIVNEYGDNNRTDCSVDKINLAQRVLPQNKNVSNIKEKNISLSIEENNETENKQDINITAPSINIEMSSDLRKKKHEDSVTSDEIVITNSKNPVFYNAIQELPEKFIIKEVRIVLEKIPHSVNPSDINCPVNVEITDHKRKRQVLGNSEGVKRPSNTPNDEEEPPSKVLLMRSSKLLDDAHVANEKKKAKGTINLRSKNTVLQKERKVLTLSDYHSPRLLLPRLDSFSNIRECMYKNKVKKVFIPSYVYNCLKLDSIQPSKYLDLEIISVESNERNRRFKRRRRKSPLAVTDDDSDDEEYSSSRRRSGRPRRLNKRTKRDKALNSIQSDRNVYGLSLRSSKNENLTKGKSLLESSSVHERAVSSSMPAALSTTKRHHESELSNEALPKKPNLSNKVSCSNNKPKTDNYLPNKKPIFAQEPPFTLPSTKELEVPTLPAGSSTGPFGFLKVQSTVKEILHNVVRMRLNQAARDPQEEEDSDDDFIGFEEELPCGCLLESDATSQNCVGYCFIRKKLSYLKRTIELSSKHSSSRRNARFCTFRPSRRQESGEEQKQLRGDKSIELRHKTSANAKPFWDPGITYMSLGVEVRSHNNKDKADCFSSKNVEVTNNWRTKRLVQVSDRRTSSIAETDKNHEEDSDSSS